VGIGLSRHDNGGSTCRAIACLPALTGAYAHPAGGALLSSSRSFGLDLAALERRDLMPTPAPRTVNMIKLGRVLTETNLNPPVKALYVYNSNLAYPQPGVGTMASRARTSSPWFTSSTSRTPQDYADIVLPPPLHGVRRSLQIVRISTCSWLTR
jgi:anaerobic selenocysteine-containing dehydrogenase